MNKMSKKILASLDKIKVSMTFDEHTPFGVHYKATDKKGTIIGQGWVKRHDFAKFKEFAERKKESLTFGEVFAFLCSKTKISCNDS